MKRHTFFQILFWGGLWALIPYLLSGASEDSFRYLMRSTVVFCGIALVVWVNCELLLPKVFHRRQQLLYVIVGLALVVLVTLIVNWDAAPWAEHFRWRGVPRRQAPLTKAHIYWRYVSIAMPYFTTFIGSTLFEIASYANRMAREAATMQSEKLETEMKFLKSQINPHFLFNALNNIYSLAVLKSDKTPDNLLKLSGMLRYVLYDCKADQVPLHKEVEYLRNFIALNLLKDSRGLNVKVDIDINSPELPVAPMLFVPFVENAFKHSRIEDIESGWITIHLRTDDTEITFEVKNSLSAQQYTKDEASGIGISNVRRRLELLYPDCHELVVQENDNHFEALLTVDCTPKSV